MFVFFPRTSPRKAATQLRYAGISLVEAGDVSSSFHVGAIVRLGFGR